MEAPQDAPDSWYYVVNGSDVHQGDILMGFPTPFVRSVRNADSEPTTYLEDRDLIVLTQTCDIPKPAQQTILLAQVVSYDALAS